MYRRVIKPNEREKINKDKSKIMNQNLKTQLDLMKKPKCLFVEKSIK